MFERDRSWRRRPRFSLDLRRRVEAWLDDDAIDSIAGRLLSRATAPLVEARARKMLVLPPSRMAFVGVGGVLLGGSGKTPVSIAVTRALAQAGARLRLRVALVGHAYAAGSRVRACRVVSPDACSYEPTNQAADQVRDEADEAGDEARVAARQLADLPNVRVVVGPNRALAAVFASHTADVVVFDGAPLVRAEGARSLGVMACPRPRSDEEARRFEKLVRGADLVVHAESVETRLSLVDERGLTRPLEELEGLRFGLATAIARPARVKRALGKLVPSAVLTLENHGRFPHEDEARLDRSLDAWLVTEKGPWLDRRTFGGRPIRFLRHAVELPHDIRCQLQDFARHAAEMSPRPA